MLKYMAISYLFFLFIRSYQIKKQTETVVLVSFNLTGLNNL
jgi:hypothetical protein